MKSVRISTLLALSMLLSVPAATRADVTDDCKSVLKQMSDTLTAAKSLKATATRSIDPKLIGEGAAKEQAEVEIIVQRPANILATSKDKDSTRQLYFDGKRLTITDKTEVGLFHAGADLSADSIDAFSAELLKRFGYQPPMTEFFTSDPYKMLLEDVKSGNIAGDEEIGGVDCQHLSFAQEGFTWDLWVAKQDHLPRKFVIKFLEIDGSPKIEANISAWDLKVDTSKTKFSWEPTEGAIEIGIIPTEPTTDADQK